MIEWLVRIGLLLLCIGFVIYAYRHTKNEEEIQDELREYVIKKLKEEER